MTQHEFHLVSWDSGKPFGKIIQARATFEILK